MVLHDIWMLWLLVSKQWYKRGFKLRGKKTYIQVLEEIDLQL
jgi:hypothetical protein